MKRSWVLGFCVAALLPAAIAIAQNAATPAHSGDGSQAQAATAGSATGNSAPEACPKTLVTDFDPDKGDFFGHDVSIWDVGGSAVMFRSGMTIDADGAPNAYNPQNTGLDDLANAGEPGHWDGLVADHGSPIVQGPDDPFPGFYVSQTALVDWNKDRDDPARYVDASKIPYIVLPGVLLHEFGARLGDFAVVMNIRRGTIADAIFADIGTLGEGSIALANDLGIWSDAREGGTRGGILYLVYPGSGDHQPHSVDEIKSETDKIFQQWGGTEKLNACETALPAPPHFQMAQRNFH
jgi:hypothetical protein